MKLTPLRDRVVVLATPSDRTEGGLYIPDVAKDKQTAIGRVVQVGPGLTRDDGSSVPMDAKVGMTVLFMRYSGVDVMIDGKPFSMIRDHEILAIYEA